MNINNMRSSRVFKSSELEELAKEVHSTAVEKGWWTVDDHGQAVVSEDTENDKIFLVVSELSEAFEEFRNPSVDPKEIYYKDGKPEGLPIELADGYIRVLDLISAYGYIPFNREYPESKRHNTLSSHMLYCIKDLLRVLDADYNESKVMYLSWVLDDIEKIAENWSSDLKEALRIKREYNATRSFRHGNKRA
jgi:hypothetical protein